MLPFAESILIQDYNGQNQPAGAALNESINWNDGDLVGELLFINLFICQLLS